MKRDIFEIRGNITPTVERLEQLANEREEQERKEREAKYERDRKEREAREAKWKLEHPILDKYTYMSEWNYETYSWIGDYINTRFYEWSDINREPMFFSHSIAFYKFLDKCKLNLTEEDNNKIKLGGCYITCVPGSHNLIVGKSYEELKSRFHMAVNLNKILEPVPETPAPETNQKVSEATTTPNVPEVVPKAQETPKTPRIISCKIFNSPVKYA